ncbi:unnamed protein product [Ambrosiozyma monospora]|uniref:Unnamed protein product n=1 Tax=Ambrosiozyma monospora TaxID=43982 RepID=A0ACB5STH2_AMBMO|nr:unnamed protein product [Ambrosiozyma monospora]
MNDRSPNNTSKVFDLKITSSIDLFHDYIKGILWSIFFTRLFGTVEPQDNHHFLDIPYPTVNYPELDDLIESKIKLIMAELESSQLDQQKQRQQLSNTAKSTPQNLTKTSADEGPGASTEKNVKDDKTQDEEQLQFKCILVLKFYQQSIPTEDLSTQLASLQLSQEYQHQKEQQVGLDSESSSTSNLNNLNQSVTSSTASSFSNIKKTRSGKKQKNHHNKQQRRKLNHSQTQPNLRSKYRYFNPWETWHLKITINGSSSGASATGSGTCDASDSPMTVDSCTNDDTKDGKEHQQKQPQSQKQKHPQKQKQKKKVSSDRVEQDFENNMFQIINYVDFNKNPIPPVKTMDLAPFPYLLLFGLNTLDPEILNDSFSNLEISLKEYEEDYKGGVNDNEYNGNDDDEEDYEEDDEDYDYEEDYDDDDEESGFRDQEIEGESQESLEYITTTENGDVIMSSSSSHNHNHRYQRGGTDGQQLSSAHQQRQYQQHRRARGSVGSGEELIRNGYKFFKKFL